MREALDYIYDEVIDLIDHAQAKQRRMDRLRPTGQTLFQMATQTLEGGERKREINLDSFIKHSVEIVETVSVPVTIQHSVFEGEGVKNIDVPVNVHLRGRALNYPPGGGFEEPTVAIMVEFPQPYGGLRPIFTFKANGDTLNHRGNFVTEQEMYQARSILQELKISDSPPPPFAR